MRIFVAGATGVVGRPLVARLVGRGHEVSAMTRRAELADDLVALGATPAVCDVYDRVALDLAVRRAEPEVVVHQLTALPPAIDPRKLETQLAANDRIRVEGTNHLVEAAWAAGAARIVAQSIAFAYAPVGAAIKDETAPLWLDCPRPGRRSVEAVAHLERRVMSAEPLTGVVLRYGYLYGPGTVYARDGSVAGMVAARKFPVVGRGGGVYSFVHVDDAVEAAVAAIEGGEPGIYNVVDDDPAPVRDWLPVFARALGAPPPRWVPALVARFVIGRVAVYYMTRQRGASNAKAREGLGWRPVIESWREGFEQMLSES